MTEGARTLRDILTAATVFLLSLVLASCAPSMRENVEFSGLSNRGLMPVSTVNPFLSSNIFLTEQMAKSPEFFEFIRSRGAPHAIKLIERRNRNPQLIMFYPNQRALYIGELTRGWRSYRWVIRGPKPIGRHDMTILDSRSLDIYSEPVFSINGTKVRFQPSIPTIPKKTITVAKIPEIKPPPKKKKWRKKRRHIVKASRSRSLSTARHKKPKFVPLNSDQQAIAISKGFAERAKNGDIIHHVKSQSETFEAIANWYTGSSKNARAVAKASKLPYEYSLKPGDRVIVPYELITNTRQMPAR